MESIVKYRLHVCSFSNVLSRFNLNVNHKIHCKFLSEFEL